MANKFKGNNSQKQGYEGPERRKAPRLKRGFILQYRIKEFPKDGRAQAVVEPSVDITQTKDLSEGGISFTAGFIPLRAVLEIRLKLPTQKEPLNLMGRVIDCKEIEKNFIYGIRVVFFDLDYNQKEVLRNFIQGFLKK